MRIAYVITRADSVGGASIHVRDLAAAMRERGHEVVVLVGGRGPVTEQLGEHNIPFQALSHLQRAIHPVHDVLAAGELVRAFRDFAPDLVSTHTAKAGWAGRTAAARLHLPAIYTPHGWQFGARVSGLPGALYATAERLAARWSSAIVCVSEQERALAISRRIPPDKLHVIHNGVKDVSRELLATPQRTPVRIVSVARFEAPKDHETLLAALSKVRTLSWELHLVGDGPRRAAIERMVQQLDLVGRVRFAGYARDPAGRLAEMQLFVLATRSEAFPRSLLEAMRAGLAIVISDVGGVREAVTHGTNGLLVPAGDPAALAAAIGGLIEDTSARGRLGSAARSTYESCFRFERTAELTAALYRHVLE